MLLTPVSSFTDGVTFQSWDAGRLSMRIDTPLFAIEGRSLGDGCKVPLDGPAPAECFVHVAYQGPLRLTLNVPLTPDVLAAVSP